MIGEEKGEAEWGDGMRGVHEMRTRWICGGSNAPGHCRVEHDIASIPSLCLAFCVYVIYTSMQRSSRLSVTSTEAAEGLWKWVSEVRNWVSRNETYPDWAVLELRTGRRIDRGDTQGVYLAVFFTSRLDIDHRPHSTLSKPTSVGVRNDEKSSQGSSPQPAPTAYSSA
jgi:hypothetical protein